MCWATKNSPSSHCSMWNLWPWPRWPRQKGVQIAAQTPAALPVPDQWGPHSLSEVHSPPETGEDSHSWQRRTPKAPKCKSASCYLIGNKDNIRIISCLKGVEAVPVIPEKITPRLAASWQRHRQGERVSAGGCCRQSGLLEKKLKL